MSGVRDIIENRRLDKPVVVVDAISDNEAVSKGQADASYLGKGNQGRMLSWADAGIVDADFAGKDVQGAVTYIASKLKVGQEVERYVNSTNSVEFIKVFPDIPDDILSIHLVAGNVMYFNFEKWNTGTSKRIMFSDWGTSSYHTSGVVTELNDKTGVKKSGDSMTGPLTISAPINITNGQSVYAVLNATSNAAGVFARNNANTAIVGGAGFYSGDGGNTGYAYLGYGTSPWSAGLHVSPSGVTQSMAQGTAGNSLTRKDYVDSHTAVDSAKLGGKAASYYNGVRAGTYNTATGDSALVSNTTGTTNTAMGAYALNANTTGASNTAFGRSALQQNVAANSNTAVGDAALASNTTGAENTSVGSSALMVSTTGRCNTAMGRLSMKSNTTGEFNVSVGMSSMSFNISGGYNTAIGTFSLQNNTSGNSNIAIGNSALGASNGNNNTAVGYGALLYAQDGTQLLNPTNVSGLGYYSKVSGDNQVQLGDSNTTTYVYGTVQNRSDERDKSDIRDTVLGLSFIEAVRPVDYKWDMRIDYQEEVTEPNPDYDETVEGSEEFITKIVQNPRDGSKKRSRYHSGVIAQEVKEVIDSLGVDFGGYQDHSIGGGNDVLSIGYDEFIAPLIKAVQELSARVKILEGK